ncbi:MAG: polysaccharide deacetylase family protein [Raineya sp.]|jgi:peptidoglycan/xylan/chitin deacetylase (PgdA/CDA1 family)|nr:polysaccharide deacetylase family protein [Raineya sp.]
MRYYKTPCSVQRIFSSFIWKKPQTIPTIYLTFDDGPIPKLTPFIINLLAQYNAKATFFCVGDNIRKHPEIFQNVIEQGHQIGNHTYNHLNAWKTDKKIYLENITLCKQEIESQGVKSTLFRPPYGKLSFNLRKDITKDHQIVMWDVLSYDFDQTLSPENCLNCSIKYTQNGSLIVFHDNIKATKNIEYALPRYLEYFSEKGFVFEKL